MPKQKLFITKITFRLEESVRKKIIKKNPNMSEFIREAIEEKLVGK